MEYLSKQRYDEIAAELNHLIHVVYPEVREQVAETSAQGDLLSHFTAVLSSLIWAASLKTPLLTLHSPL